MSIGCFRLVLAFSGPREETAAPVKASVAKLLREEIGEMERRVEGEMRDWCDNNITKRIREIRSQTREALHSHVRACAGSLDVC